MHFENYLYSIFIFLILFFFLKKFKILNENILLSSHKKLIVEKNNPILMGGLFLMSIILFFFEISLILKISLIFITILGILSDKNILSNPFLRLILQLLIIVYLIYFQSLSVQDLRNFYLNIIVENRYFNFIFTAFCFAILVNGCNFMDGLNGLLIGYSSMILISVLFLKLSNHEFNIIYFEFVFLLLFSLIILLIFNLSGFIYLGDSGSYLIALFLGFYLIEFYNFNPNLSPYYVALILWYPAFENLFSLSRRVIKKLKVSNPDNGHLHQLLYSFIKKKKMYRTNFINSLTSMIILFINFPSFLVGTIYSNNSKVLIFLTFLNIFIYLLSYFILFKILKKMNNLVISDKI